jgi:transposase
MSGYKELGYIEKSTVDSTSAQIQYKEADIMIYVGIDVASQKHDFFIMNDLGEAYTTHSITIPNSNEGYKKLHNSIQEFCGATNDFKVRIGLESTGFYHKNIVSYLLSLDYEIMVINPILTNMYKKSKKVHIQKNDNIDSIYICKYLMDTETVFKPYTTISYHTDALKALSRERFSLVDELRLAKISIYKLLTQLFPEYLKLFTNVYQGSALDILEKYYSPSKLSKAHIKTISSMIHGKCKTSAETLIEAAKTSIGIQNDYLSFQLSQAIKRLKSIESEIDEYNNQISKYVDMINPNILTISGVGYITAGLILGEIGDINNFKNSEHLISYAGLDVKIYESGKYKAINTFYFKERLSISTICLISSSQSLLDT